MLGTLLEEVMSELDCGEEIKLQKTRKGKSIQNKRENMCKGRKV